MTHIADSDTAVNQNLNHALAYAKLGWAVLPLSGKVPATKGHGYLDASRDETAIRSWWKKYPSANIGVSCGASGFFTVDVDPRNGGDATFAELVNKHGPMPHTVLQATGGGGQHLLFKSDEWSHSPRGVLGTGIDIKWRGYIVVAPSIHPDTGKQYEWTHSPFNCAIAQPPAWVIQALFPVCKSRAAGQSQQALEEAQGWGSKPRYSFAALGRAADAIAAAGPGQRNNVIVREAFSIGTLVGAGLMPRELAYDTLIYAASLMSEPMSEDEIRKRIERSILDGEKKPRTFDHV